MGRSTDARRKALHTNGDESNYYYCNMLILYLMATSFRYNFTTTTTQQINTSEEKSQDHYHLKSIVI